jgi:hypothetical protein
MHSFCTRVTPTDHSSRSKPKNTASALQAVRSGRWGQTTPSSPTTASPGPRLAVGCGRSREDGRDFRQGVGPGCGDYPPSRGRGAGSGAWVSSSPLQDSLASVDATRRRGEPASAAGVPGPTGALSLSLCLPPSARSGARRVMMTDRGPGWHDGNIRKRGGAKGGTRLAPSRQSRRHVGLAGMLSAGRGQRVPPSSIAGTTRRPGRRPDQRKQKRKKKRVGRRPDGQDLGEQLY